MSSGCKDEVCFHCTKRARKSGAKAKHDVLSECSTLKTVLKFRPDYGAVIPGCGGLRKMRLHVPGVNKGKSGGYRVIYRQLLIEDTVYVIFLQSYFKSDSEDLTPDQYETLLAESEQVIEDYQSVEWDS